MGKIKAVLSDLGGVVALFPKVPFVPRFMDIPEVLDSLPDDEAGRAAVERGVWEIQAGFERGEMSEMEYRRRISRLFGLGRPLPWSAFETRFYDTFVLNVPVRDLYLEIRGRGTVMVAVSNLCPVHETIMRRIGVFAPFDDLILSHEEGIIKPSRELAIRSLDRAGVAAEEAVYVDDLPENLEPYRQLGVRAHLFTDFVGLRDFLAEVGLPV